MQPLQICLRRLIASQKHPLAIYEGLFPENDMPVAVVRNLMPLIQHSPDQAFVVKRAPLSVLLNVGIVVVFDSAPGGRAVLSRLIRVIFRSVPHDIKGTLGPVLSQRIEQNLRQRPTGKAIRACRKIHGAVVEGHGANTFFGADPLNSAGIAQMGLRLGQRPAQHGFPCFSDFYNQRHVAILPF